MDRIPLLLQVADLHQQFEALLEILDAGQLEPPIEHVLARHAELQATGAQTLIGRAHVSQDDVAFVGLPDLGREAQAHVRLFRAVDADQNAKALAAPVAQLVGLLLCAQVKTHGLQAPKSGQ